ncbi:glycosyltransferase family 2 protein [Elizabethkingia sp. JS20170427COW]|uniref:glycosyltransferase family 2 protein n=1 Tax=Elizabethkingia sp. JS20170427COW TaxID=2583851 RepID=UPI001110611A|nr:glycosyltransferase family 2 protein [Elizabethkingia sp. JS20170427COW]QCX53432.1 glycosyltransferase family 2 protein [Elizabethkingia sp. JS20170427COW]
MKLFSIIVIYNGMHRDWIQKCFSSLQNSSLPNQIIAIDNNSSDNSVEYIKAHFPNVLLLESKENLGFGGANNLGLKKALEMGGEYFFLLNQDAWVEENTLEILVQLSKKNPDYGIISPLQLDGTGERLEWGFSNSIGYDYNKDFFSDFVLNKPKKDLYNTTESYAASWLLTKETLRKVGGFNPSFFHYGEDDNYCKRTLFKNLKIGVTPHTSICHDTYHKPENKFKNFEETEKRRIIQLLSDPNTQGNAQIITQLRNKMIKSFLFFDFKQYKVYYRLHSYFRTHFSTISENNIKSSSNQKFIFIKH